MNEKTIEELLKQITKKLTNIESEIETINAIGEEMGHIQLINIAMALWRKSLQDKKIYTSEQLQSISIYNVKMQNAYDIYIRSYCNRKSMEIKQGIKNG
ncbi:MAG: hypothetical protein IPN57_09745 [Ignavibacteria bacterium]|nr:hypothetical protein [Ignavibacteria bacterium]